MSTSLLTPAQGCYAAVCGKNSGIGHGGGGDGGEESEATIKTQIERVGVNRRRRERRFSELRGCLEDSAEG